MRLKYFYHRKKIFSPQENKTELMAWEKKLNKQASGNENEDYVKCTWDRIQKSRNVAEQTA